MTAHKQKLLIVDDKAENLLALEKVLKATGAELVKAASGDAALAASLNHDFAAAILDVQMPGMDGYELAGLLRGEEKTRELPVIFLTAAYTEEAHVFKGYETGAVDFITKPFDPQILRSKVAVFLRLDRQKTDLRRSEERFRSLVSATSQIVWTTDPRGAVSEDIPAYRAFTGQSVGEIRGSGWLDALHPEDRQGAAAAWEEAVKTRSIYDTQYRLRRRDGAYRLFSVKGVPVFGDNGGIREWVGTLTDITEREAAQADMRLHGEIMANVGEGVYLIRAADGTILVANPKFEEMFGYGPGEMLGKHVSIVNAPGDLDPAATVKRVMAELEEKGTWQGEVENIKKDGARFWCHASVSLFQHHEYGKVLISVHTDITESRRAAERLKRYSSQLEATNEELASFAYSVSHDLRAPLRSIDGFSLALLEDSGEKLDAEGRQHLQRVRAAAQRMGSLIDDLLSLSRVTRREISWGNLDMSALALAVAGDLRKANPGRDVELDIEEGVSLDGDAALIKIALENLIGNAWQFTGKLPKGRIRFGAAIEDGMTTLFVRDNGAGFDMAYAGKLFQAFQRLHRTEEFPGNGIGLATVRRIITLHGGRIWAEASPGEGATFFFTIGQKKEASHDQRGHPIGGR
ncbi:MAG: PAS domain S-box protein [Elusimicrobiota bacterium]